MKYAVVFALLYTLAMLACTPAVADGQPSCKAYFQVVQQDGGNLHAGMDGAQKKWWENTGHKKYPDLCWDGSVSSNDKPRYLVIWSKSGSSDEAKLSKPDGTKTTRQPASGTIPNVYGQHPEAIEKTAPTAWLYKGRWNIAQVSLVTISFDGKMELPPVWVPVHDHPFWWPWADSPKVLEGAMKYLAQESVLSVTAGVRSTNN